MAYHENIFAMRISNLRVWIYIRYLKTHGLRCLKMTLHRGTTIADTQDEEKHVMKQLLRRRSNVLYELNVYDSDMHQLLVSFNDRLRKACAELYNKVMTTYEEYCNRTDSLGDFEVEGKIYLGAEYPKHHPLQTETAKQAWDALTQGGFEPLYDDGCAWSLHCSKEYPPEHGGCETFEKWIGMEDENDNWNEGLDREWSKDLHMIQPFHNLYDHCYFSLYDLI